MPLFVEDWMPDKTCGFSSMTVLLFTIHYSLFTEKRG